MYLPITNGKNIDIITQGVYVIPDSIAITGHGVILPNDALPTSDTNRKLRFGFKSGISLSNTNFNKGFPRPTVPVETAWKYGFAGGLLLEVPIYKNLHLQQEYLFSSLGGEVVKERVRYRFSYLSLPVLLKYKVVNKFALLVGSQFDLILQVTESSAGNTKTIVHETEGRSFGAVAGVTYKISDTLSLDARYISGINHIGIRLCEFTKEFKLEIVQLSFVITPFR
ncbi:porin family protein [Pontibacter pamirensis]|uniref:porin family protein n=1 Tax=Pontibacter pamirensis TaxID=2562824 RepID=UPI00138A24D9|nr:porin family protein [Pontibacter pamirensis]